MYQSKAKHSTAQHGLGGAVILLTKEETMLTTDLKTRLRALARRSHPSMAKPDRLEALEYAVGQHWVEVSALFDAVRLTAEGRRVLIR